MTDTKAIERAGARLTADPSLLERTEAEILALAEEERRINHPAPDHYRTIDAAIHAAKVALHSLDQRDRPARLLELERQRAIFSDRLDAAKSAWRVEKDRQDRAGIAHRAAMLAGGCISIPTRDQSILDAAGLLRHRIEMTLPSLSLHDESAFLDRLADMEDATRAFQAAIGISRRDSRIRMAADRANETANAFIGADREAA